MAECLRCTRIDWAELRESAGRNKLASILAGFLFFSGWWFAIDVAAVYTSKSDIKDVFHLCGVFATLSMFMVNTVSNGQLRGEAYTEGCMGQRGAWIWAFLGFLLGFGSLIGAFWILFGIYVVPQSDERAFQPSHLYPGVAIFMQNILIFAASLVFKFGRSESDEPWG